MPIQLNEENGGKTLVIHISGKVIKADYKPFVPEFERLLQQHGKLRVMFDMTDFHGWDAGALWEDIKFDIKHFADIQRLAVVGDKRWHQGMAMFCKPFTKATTRYFNHADAAEALKWLDESVATGNKLGGRHMLKHQLLLPEGILILEPNAPLEAADFEGLIREIDPYIAEHGKLSGLMIHAKAFPGWANLDAFLAHMQFIKSHHQKIVRLAMVTDSKLLGELPKIAAYLVHVQVKHFSESQHEDALRWLKDGTPVSP
jgi:stage II sporulation SpoAA-like protein